MFKVGIMILEFTICRIQKIRKCVRKLGVKDLTVYILICLKTETKVKIEFSSKAKPHILNVSQKLKVFNKINDVSK